MQDHGHPLAGYRQFGLTTNNSPTGVVSYTFFTRAIDRPYGFLDAIGSNTIFSGADKLWNTLMSNLSNYINKNGGEAQVGLKISKRVSWSKDILAKDKEYIKESSKN